MTNATVRAAHYRTEEAPATPVCFPQCCLRSFVKTHPAKNSFHHHLQDKANTLWHVMLKEFLRSYQPTWAGPSLTSIPWGSPLPPVFSGPPEHQGTLSLPKSLLLRSRTVSYFGGSTLASLQPLQFGDGLSLFVSSRWLLALAPERGKAPILESERKGRPLTHRCGSGRAWAEHQAFSCFPDFRNVMSGL